jgi:hypothetical protein
LPLNCASPETLNLLPFESSYDGIISWLGKSPLFPHLQTFSFFAHGAFVLEPWTNAIKGKKLPAPNLN